MMDEMRKKGFTLTSSKCNGPFEIILFATESEYKIVKLVETRLYSNQEIATILDEEGLTTITGLTWNAKRVSDTKRRLRKGGFVEKQKGTK